MMFNQNVPRNRAHFEMGKTDRKDYKLMGEFVGAVPLIMSSLILLYLGWWLEQWRMSDVIDTKRTLVLGIIFLCMVVGGFWMFINFQQRLDHPNSLALLDPNLFAVPWWVGLLRNVGGVLALLGSFILGTVARRIKNDISRFV